MRSPIATIVLIIIAASMFGAKFSFFIPLVIIYFAVIRPMQEKNKRNSQNPQQPRSRKRYDPYTKKPPTRRREQYRERPAPRPRKAPPPPRPKPRANPFKKTGVEKYKDYDYDGAIEDFQKSLDIEPTDIPTHFNIACAYSLTEQKEEAYKYLDKAVRLGFKDFERIRTHDAFAYLRVQDDFEAFEENGFRVGGAMQQKQTQEDAVDPDLLEKLKKLADLRDRGILTDEEFVIQKEKLLR